ncbi:type II toxin-antitoxin system VapC family toxin [Thauera linaloolentis]|uniref:PilT protein domain-containing protein n=1 Tax=Thauera linaloolentis (strain DSM 12138 / JCM 21573 / CCUG 41526 / CIP 105981 / IAM 15112 / NBRC 102519 / 47Lol) TaxID=1123367 RepID=N6Z226_THAL4|nr:type II toxin-antitoxin system VapC family toxin [Thauera linaloolentis]ENO88408.1 PilT protein domain-containing protein [Thauera linaloolentis 47Lol = DSM 12138]MCM8566457.1 type II toxin-antitoxin system VapC family toxin [Thauera linaloolentis]
MSFVLDNLVAMCWLLADGKPADVAYAETVLDALQERQALVPSLWALEAGNVIARGEAKGLLTEARSQEFVALLGRLNIAMDTATAAHALGDPLHLARRYKLSAYDAAYLELALRTGSPLATLDSDLKKTAQAAGVQPFAPN